MATARDIMTKNVLTVTRDMAIKDLSKMFIDNRVNGFPVVDDQGTVIGIVTEKNLIEQNKNLHMPTVIALFDAVFYLESTKNFQEEVKRYTGTMVGDIYHANAVTVSPETDVSEIAALMANKGLHSLPVVENEKLIGIIGKIDIIKALTQD